MSTPPPGGNPPTAITVESIVPVPLTDNPLADVSLELEKKQTELENSRLHNRELREKIEGRGDWGTFVFWLLLGWLVSVLVIIILQGFAFKGFHLDNSVIIAFIGTTTADVLALGYIVATHLFPKAS